MNLLEVWRRALLALIGLGIVSLVGNPLLAQGDNTPAEIITALQGGGHVVYFRHAATTRSGVDRIEWPRERQRLLSEQGIADSQYIGEAFLAHSIPVGEVLASPFARCRDMAEIAFGRVEERMELLGLLSNDEGRAARIAYLKNRITTPPASGTNRMIVAHRSNIAAAANVSLAEGEAVVMIPTGNGEFRVLGTLRPRDW